MLTPAPSEAGETHEKGVLRLSAKPGRGKDGGQCGNGAIHQPQQPWLNLLQDKASATCRILRVL